MAATQPGAAMTSDGVDFVDEDYARCVLFALVEQVTHATGAHPDKHLHEVRTGHGEKRYAGFTGHSSGQQGLAGTGRTQQQSAFGNLAAELLELAGIFEKLDDFLQLLLSFVGPGDIAKGDTRAFIGEQFGFALTEREKTLGSAAALHLANEEQPDENQYDPRRSRQEVGEDIRAFRLGHDLDAAFYETVDQITSADAYAWYPGPKLGVGLSRGNRGEHLGFFQNTFDFKLRKRHLADIAVVNFSDKLRVPYLGAVLAEA